MLRIGVLASGGGTDLQSILDACESGQIDGKVVVVISNNRDAYALERAREFDTRAVFLDHPGKSREQHEREIARVLDHHWRIKAPTIPVILQNITIHPSLESPRPMALSIP